MSYSLAFDIGTTTIVGYLCNNEDKTIVCTIENSNPQLSYGLDVVSRITYAMESKSNKEELSICLGNSVMTMAEELLELVLQQEGEQDYNRCDARFLANDKITSMVVVCNPVIMGFFEHYLGVVGGIVMVDVTSNQKRIIKELVIEREKIELIPGIGGYVGADALAASYEVNSVRDNRKVLLVDLGTNTEIVLLTDDVKMATSAAAGPALEGGNITCGMRGLTGAIDRITNEMTGLVDETCAIFATEIVDDKDVDIAIHVIGEKEAQGICGSGVLDLISLLLKCGIVDNTGYLLSKSEALMKNIPTKIANRIEDVIEDEKEMITTRIFRLTEKIFVSQDDIRAIQLAKSAIRSGIDMLLIKNNLTTSVIDEIYIAGAFGLKVDIDSVLSVGMLPVIDNCHIIQSGNIAGIGACHMAVETDIITSVIDLKNEILTISLDAEETFQNLFFDNINFSK